MTPRRADSGPLDRSSRLSGLLAMVLSAALLPRFAQAQGDSGLDGIQLPPGFEIQIWTDEVPNARSLALGGSGTVFVATRRDGRVFAVRRNADDPPVVTTIAEGLRMPNGVAMHDGDLYVAENHRIIRFDDIESALDQVPEPVVVSPLKPAEGHHGWRYIAFGPDGKLYVSIGAPCNTCEREGAGNITRMNPDGTQAEVYAFGVRNSVGFDWQPGTGALWFTDNGRDMLGDDRPPDELNFAPRAGLHFGFPYCHGSGIPDPQYGQGHSCEDYRAPARELGAHVAPLGMLFYSGTMFPAEYRGRIFIAEHGSWNRSRKNGYRITMVPLENGRPAAYEEFAVGWLQGESVAGRPVDLLELEDGSVLVSDDQNGAIYRITYTRPLDDGVAPF